MNHPDTKQMLDLVEQRTGYRVSVDLISGINEQAQMISARPECKLGVSVHFLSLFHTTKDLNAL
jgi:hypothetical protein